MYRFRLPKPRLGCPRVLARGGENHGASLVGLRDRIIFDRRGSVLGLHDRVSVDAELLGIASGPKTSKEKRGI